MKRFNLFCVLALSCAIGFVACDSDDDTTSNPAGETPAGESAGETPAGEAAGESAGETTAGETTAGETTAGETTAGETTAGESAGETPAGESAGETPAGESAGETPAGETPAGETPAGETPAGETPEVTCEMQCGDFANCAISDCEGYNEMSYNLLYDGCMAICGPSPAIAGVYAMYETCAEKLEFASNAREGFAEICAGGAASFCQRYQETCDDWTADTSCIEWYDAAAPGTAEDMSGATQGCYEYHLGVASDMEPEVHCLHAAGAAPCVDPSERAVAFCMNYEMTCGMWTNPTSCTEWFDAAAPGTPDDMGGATQGCYEYHLNIASMMDPEVHCPHAAGVEACID